MAVDQPDKKLDQPEKKAAAAQAPVAAVCVDDSRAATKKEHSRIEETSGKLVHPVGIDGASTTPEAKLSVTGKILLPDAKAMEQTVRVKHQTSGFSRSMKWQLQTMPQLRNL